MKRLLPVKMILHEWLALGTSSRVLARRAWTTTRDVRRVLRRAYVDQPDWADARRIRRARDRRAACAWFARHVRLDGTPTYGEHVPPATRRELRSGLRRAVQKVTPKFLEFNSVQTATRVV